MASEAIPHSLWVSCGMYGIARWEDLRPSWSSAGKRSNRLKLRSVPLPAIAEDRLEPWHQSYQYALRPNPGIHVTLHSVEIAERFAVREECRLRQPRGHQHHWLLKEYR